LAALRPARGSPPGACCCWINSATAGAAREGAVL